MDEYKAAWSGWLLVDQVAEVFWLLYIWQELIIHGGPWGLAFVLDDAAPIIDMVRRFG